MFCGGKWFIARPLIIKAPALYGAVRTPGFYLPPPLVTGSTSMRAS